MGRCDHASSSSFPAGGSPRWSGRRRKQWWPVSAAMGSSVTGACRSRQVGWVAGATGVRSWSLGTRASAYPLLCCGVMHAAVAEPGHHLHVAVSLLRGRHVVALTGAGISTESGIPDYRGPATQARARNPIQHAEFVRDPAARRRYWARSVIGWPRVAGAAPNAAHAALAAMERGGALSAVITQNVDRLHARAGSRRVVELHGALAEVACLACGRREGRAELQERLLALNPEMAGLARAAIAGPGPDVVGRANPDGDAELPAGLVDRFRVADCQACGGVLKPDVVFFGGSVPRDVVAEAYGLVDAAEALLVVGSSLAVYSGYRFVRRAAERGAPIAIVNLGPTRGDPLAALRWDERACAALPPLAAML